MQPPFARGGPELLIAVGAGDYEQFVADHMHLLALGGTPPIRIVRTSELTDPDNEADVVFARYTAKSPGRRMLFSTIELETYEQDEAGLIYCDDELVKPTPPVAFGEPRSRSPGVLRRFREAVLLFSVPGPGAGYHSLTVCPTRPILDLVAFPRVSARPFDPDWLEKAHAWMAPEWAQAPETNSPFERRDRSVRRAAERAARRAASRARWAR